MFDISRDLGVQSWCFREFVPHDQLIAQVKGIGLKRLEICAKHVDFNNQAAFDGIIKTYRDAGIQIISIGVQYFKGDPAEEKWFDFAKRAGASMISASFNIDKVPQLYRTCEQLAEKYDLVLGIHNHGGYDWLGNSGMLGYVFRNTGPRIGLCLDTAWSIQAGQDPVKIAEQFSDRLYGVHIKDFIFGRTGAFEDVIVGTGALKLRELMAVVQKAPKFKVATLEYEGDHTNPAPKLKECIQAIQAAVNP